MPLFEPEVLETLQGVPPSWDSGYTPVINKCGFVLDWQNKPLTIHEAIKLGTHYINPKKPEKGPTTLNGIGLHLNEYTKTGCLDFDKENLTKEEIESKFQEHFGRSINELPKSICWTSGKLNRYQIAFKIPEEYWETITHIKDNPKLPEMELRWGKCQSVLPPSRHPETGSYRWINSPNNVPLAIAPEWFLHGWAMLSKPTTKPKKRKFIDFIEKRTRDELDYDSSRVSDGLMEYCQDHKFINYSSKPNYTPWSEIGMALHHLSKEIEEATEGKTVDTHLDDWLEWSSKHDNYSFSECMKKWESGFDYKPDSNKQIKIGTFFDYCEAHPKHPRHKNYLRRHEMWDELELLEPTPQKEPPKRKRDELLKDIFKAAVNGDSNSYYEDYAEMYNRFRSQAKDINKDLLICLRDEFNNQKFNVGEVDMNRVDSLDYLLEGYVIKGEVGILYGPFATGKTSLACGMVRSGYNKVGFLDQVRKRNNFESLVIMSDGGANRFKEVYEELGLKPEMLTVWAADNKQGLTSWKCDLRGLIKLHKFLKNNPQKKLVIIDSVISMLSGTPFDYTNNTEVDLIVKFLREIICEPLGVSIVLLSHLNTDGVSSSGAKRWVGACGWAAQIKAVKVNDQEEFDKRKLCIWKDPINGKRVFDYKVGSNGIFETVYSHDVNGDCFGELKQHLQQINFQTGRKVFSGEDFHQIDYSESQVNKTIRKHLNDREGVLKKQKDASGKTVRGKYVLKTPYILVKDNSKEIK